MTHYTQATKLRLKTKHGLSGKSVIEDMFFTPPLKIIHPIYDGDIANIMLISVSAGLMKGDDQEIELDIGDRSLVRLTSQSFEKIHDTEDGKASRHTKIHVGKDALLDFSPLPILPFGNASFDNFTHIILDKDSRLYHNEIYCAGRVSRGEVFAFKRLDSKLSIKIDGELVFFDNMLLEPEFMDLKSCCMFGDYTHYLNLVIYDRNVDFEILRQRVVDSPLNAAVSRHDAVIVVKALDYGSEPLLDFKRDLLEGLL
ncbi:urease accessory protein UreD [Helicobacter mustelae]|uniref:Putative urease accessory protein UreH n=1 Tax=Helicobacter mustelae (strain ATCC 43772 / CCUG 25715 / CIP 103759 / LMG 18044 / NCTC 12198 / R85-136P) TaxID=679897 RepID=D3UGF2_HELM1|nr:urease accessory protein UreD [Helicobacter mustelae]CBG39573.1 putative urease accessory protein UreH [Helicobacter mustelae 12198]SQH71085.1 urease accessory protein UreH [Helicobacter mustelae]STP12214.1 urease accessory protein UreH [Helicobacter mustelae]